MEFNYTSDEIAAGGIQLMTEDEIDEYLVNIAMLEPWCGSMQSSLNSSNAFCNCTLTGGSSIPSCGNCNCFVAGTKVLMADGSRRSIEHLRVGDRVMSCNEVTGRIESKRVLRTSHPFHNDLVAYEFSNGRQLISTTDHPYYVAGFGLSSYEPSLTNARYRLDKTVSQITVRDTVYDVALNTISIKSIDLQPKRMVQTHIISVESNHNFFANDILVHNK